MPGSSHCSRPTVNQVATSRSGIWRDRHSIAPTRHSAVARWHHANRSDVSVVDSRRRTRLPLHDLARAGRTARQPVEHEGPAGLAHRRIREPRRDDPRPLVGRSRRHRASRRRRPPLPAAQSRVGCRTPRPEGERRPRYEAIAPPHPAHDGVAAAPSRGQTAKVADQGAAPQADPLGLSQLAGITPVRCRSQ